MKLTNLSLGNSVVILDPVLDKIEPVPLAQNNRAIGGQYYTSRFGLDEIYTFRGRIDSIAKYNVIKNYIKGVVILSEFDNNDGQNYSGEYLLEKLTIEKFGLENGWYHVEFSLKKYFVKN